MDQKTLESFISAAYHLNFSNAAIDCHITQATLSRQIAAREEEIGTELFVRHKSGVTLTPAGSYLFSCSHSLLEQYKDIVTNCRRAVYNLSPKLRVGFGPCEHYLFSDPLSVLHEQRPFMEVGCMSYTYKILTSRFRNHSIDIGVCTDRCAKAVDGLSMVPIYCEPWQVVARSDHPFWDLPGELKMTLSNQTLLISYNNEYEETVLYCKNHHLKPANYIESNFLQSQIPLLMAGIGIALLPPFLKPYLPSSLLMEDILETPLAPTFVLAYYPDNSHPAIQALRKYYAEQETDIPRASR
ncbi:MAG: LysR family transcriptional regulator [Lachnospiraceae bacterium]|nr:LysR family transcriptional regulator [Lachnospiraceae bacterium]